MTDPLAAVTGDERKNQERAVERAEWALERTRARPPRQTPPRVEQVRARVQAGAELLLLVGRHLDTLHELAYDRPAAAERLAVKGGQPDYALDTHGDPRARELYRSVVWEVTDLLEDSAVVCHDIVRWMKDGSSTRRRRTGVDAQPAEIVAALEAQRRRIGRGESAAPIAAQPKPKAPTQAELLAELTALRSAVRKVTPKMTKGDRRRLTPAETRALDNAIPKPGQKLESGA